MTSIILFCEGTEDSNKSYDRQILRKLLPAVTVQTFGGKMGYKQYKLAYLQMNKGLFEKAYIFRDRDFDFDYQYLEQKPHLIGAGKNEFSSFRTCIENYMLDIDFFFSFLEEKYAHRDFLKTKLELEFLYKTAAKEICYYSAMRHALGFVRKPFPFLKTKPADANEKDINFTNYDKTNCKKEMQDYFNRFLAAIPQFSEQELNEKFEFFCQKFEKDSFYDTQAYMIWFNGKELMKQINQNFKKDRIEISLKEDYFSWLMDNHTKDMWLKFDDLKELVEKVK
jgi:hypothetical protein